MHRISAWLTLVLLAAYPAWCRDVRIGVLGLFHPATLTVSGSQNSWPVLSGCGWKVVIDPANGNSARFSLDFREISVSYAGRLLRCNNVDIASREGTSLVFEMSVPGKIRRRYRGIAHITADSSQLVATIDMDLELAVASVVAAEIAPSTPTEAIKAQAIAVRSYFVGARTGHRNFDFCDTTHCQVVKSPAVDSPAANATAETAGQVLLYAERPVAAMYSASCGGRTRSLEEIGVDPKNRYPFYAVECSYCRRNAKAWQRDAHAGVPRTERERTAIGRQHGWSAVPGNNFQVIDNGATLQGRGSGHGVGLCEAGAAAMARDGADHRAILAHYYPNTVVGQLRP